jgi:hypothetical protein
MRAATQSAIEAARAPSREPLVEAEAVPREAQGLAAGVFAAGAALLIAVTPLATRAAPFAKGWWVEPRTWPLFCLGIVMLASLWQVAQWLRAPAAPDGGAWQRAAWAFGELRIAFELAGYFCLYLFAVTYFGFALSSFAFMQLVIARVGLRSWAWRLAAGLFVVAVIIVFRLGLGIYFPLAPIYEQFAPPWFIRTIAIYL